MKLTIADKCRVARKYLHLSQQDFGKLIGLCQSEVSFCERGYIPSETACKKIRYYYNKSVHKTDDPCT